MKTGKSPTLSSEIFELLRILRIAKRNAIKYDMHEWSMYNIPNWKFGMLHISSQDATKGWTYAFPDPGKPESYHESYSSGVLLDKI